jgi:hypothetical protein
LILSGVSACTTREMNGDVLPPNMAQIRFESDYARDTTFKVNTHHVTANLCHDFNDIDYAEQLSASPISGMPTMTSISGQPIAITAHHFLETTGLFSNCGPLTRVFIPEANVQYVARLLKERDVANGGEDTGLCVLDIQKLDAASGSLSSVRTMDFAPCV